MPVSVRPTGVLCNNYVYSDKSNVWGKVKQFLFETDTGRTDVLFICGAGSGIEPNQWKYSADPNDYHYTGGLIDGISKALIKGNANWSGRSLYATPIFLGWQTHQVPNFNSFDSSTWNNPNTTGVGNYLSGCSTIYGNINFYTNNTLGTKSTACLAVENVLGAPTNTFYSWNPESEESSTQNNISQVWNNSNLYIGSPGQVWNTNNRSYLSFVTGSFSKGITNTSEYNTFTNPEQICKAFNSYISFTPNQPTRYWDRESIYTIQKSDFWYIGIGYMDPVTETVIELFPNAGIFEYIPDTLTIGTTKQQLIDFFSNTITLSPTITLDKLTSPDIITTPLVNENLNDPVNFPVQTANGSSYFGSLTGILPEAKDYLAADMLGKRLVIRKIQTFELFAKFNFNIAPNRAAITNKAAWDSFDAIDLDPGNSTGLYLVKKIFPTANYRTLPKTASGQIEFLNKTYYKLFGLNILANPAVAPGQEGTPQLITYGIRLQNLCSNTFTATTTYNTFRSAGTPFPVSGLAKINGLPLTLNTAGIHTFFYLTQFDTPSLTNANTVIDKNRGIIIKPKLGLFFDSLGIQGGLYSPITRELTEVERNQKLSIFKSNVFTYVVNTATLKQYQSEPGTLDTSANIVMTGHYLPASIGASLTEIEPASVKTLSGSLNTNLESARGLNLVESTKVFNLSSINTNHNIKELRFGFVGKDTNDTAKGNLLVTSHYGIDPNNQHGIAFTVIDKSFLSRTGDNGYRAADGKFACVHGVGEIFRSVYNRQTKFNNTTNRKKVVIFMEIGIWELADLAATYNGAGAWDYLKDTTSNTRRSPYNSNSLIEAVLQSAINIGFTKDELTVVCYTPGFLSQSNLPGYGTAHNFNFSNNSTIDLFFQNVNTRANYIRASEIFYNNIITECGVFNPCPPSLFDALTNPYVTSMCHVTLGQIPTTPWLPPFTKILNYTTDPVSGAPLEFLTISTDRLDIEPYLVELDALCDQGNVQAKRTLSRYKTKILQ